MVKRKKTITKHDLKRGVIGNRQMMESLLDRITNLEYIMMYYIEMKKDQKKFEKFLDKKKVDIKDVER
jgi:hypothetical protein|tara:strand:+ start:2309 stop:2512 length:204 start_codon:yes stop_codon:yes gene_type:complete